MAKNRFMFRAWNKVEKKMAYGCQFLIGGDGKFYWDSGWDSVTAAIDITGKFIEMLGMNRTDMNGKQIFEGDIVRHAASSTDKCVKEYDMDPRRWDFIIEFNGVAFGERGSVESLHHPDDIEWKAFDVDCDENAPDTSDWLVVGNIHENPELLKTAE